MTTIQKVLRMQTTVRTDGKINISNPELHSGDDVEVIILLPPERHMMPRSALDILAEAPGHRLFETAADVDEYLQQERTAWDD